MSTNATAKRPLKCGGCRATIPAGARLFIYRERALSSHEACHAGTMYPKRYRCSVCAERRSSTHASPLTADKETP